MDPRNTYYWPTCFLCFRQDPKAKLYNIFSTFKYLNLEESLQQLNAQESSILKLNVNRLNGPAAAEVTLCEYCGREVCQISNLLEELDAIQRKVSLSLGKVHGLLGMNRNLQNSNDKNPVTMLYGKLGDILKQAVKEKCKI